MYGNVYDSKRSISSERRGSKVRMRINVLVIKALANGNGCQVSEVGKSCIVMHAEIFDIQLSQI